MTETRAKYNGKDVGEFQTETIKVLRPANLDQKNSKELKIVRYIKDGRAFSPQLINQEVYKDRVDGKIKHGKNKGLQAGDWKFLTQTPGLIEEIQFLLNDVPTATPPKPPAPKPDFQKAAANDDPFADEVPF